MITTDNCTHAHLQFCYIKENKSLWGRNERRLSQLRALPQLLTVSRTSISIRTCIFSSSLRSYFFHGDFMIGRNIFRKSQSCSMEISMVVKYTSLRGSATGRRQLPPLDFIRCSMHWKSAVNLPLQW